MSAEVVRTAVDPLSVRLARVILTRAVRGRAAEGTAWGEAMLSEFEETGTPTEAVRWTVSGLPVAWRERRKRRSDERSFRVRVTRRIVVSVVVAAIAVAAINWLVATAVYEPSASMQPTYSIGTRVLVDKLGFRMTGLHEGDVVSVYLPKQLSQNPHALKRIVGLPGDKMGCDPAGRVTRNGSVVPYGFLHSNGVVSCPTVTVPSGDIYIIGDNLDDSADSRYFGPVPGSAVTGRVSARLW